MKLRCGFCEKGRRSVIERQTEAFREVALKRRRASGNALLMQVEFEEYVAPPASGTVIEFPAAKETD
jgi:hypothetical protein